MLKNKNFGWGKAVTLYSCRFFVRASVIPLILSVISLPITIISSKQPIFFINLFVDLIINILPGIIGFLLSGYAIIIGFSSNEIVKFMSKMSEKEDQTLYQKQNAVFAVSILSLLLGLISGIIISFVSKSEINFLPNDHFINIINYLVLFYIFYVVYFSVLSIKDMVINVFNFGQLIHYWIQKQSKKSE